MKQLDDNLLLYRRVYRLHKRNFKPVEIATILELPVSTVNQVVNHLLNRDKNRIDTPESIAASSMGSDIVEIITMQRKGYLVVDIGGNLVLQKLKPLRDEFTRLLEQDDNPVVALRLYDVTLIDSSAIGLMVNFSKKMEKNNRKVMFLDPSESVESIIRELNINTVIPIMGTELALERHLEEMTSALGTKRPRRTFY